MNNKYLLISIVFAFAVVSCTAQKDKVGSEWYHDEDLKQTSCFFDNSPMNKLELPDLYVEGEIANPGKVDFSKLTEHDMIVKETLLENGEDKFIGAYRYVGYSLADILNLFTLQKENAEAFPPIVDLYVEIENDKGDKIVVSWGEIFFSNDMDDIIIASGVARIIPEKSKDMWPIPTETKLVVMDDLITARNISNPTKITVKSYKNDDIEIIKGKKPLYSPTIDLIVDGKNIITYDEKSDFGTETSVHNIFYGKGRGLHSTKPFNGYSVDELLSEYVSFDIKSLQKKLVVVVADDGYRTIYTWSELCNRNDQADILLICNPELTHKGIFRFYPSCDFFSDRAIKGVQQIIVQ